MNSKAREPSPTYQKGLLAPFPLEEANVPSAPPAHHQGLDTGGVRDRHTRSCRLSPSPAKRPPSFPIFCVFSNKTQSFLLLSP